MEMIKQKLKYLLTLVILFTTVIGFAQRGTNPDEGYVINSDAERPISPSYRISEKPEIIDTVVPIPTINYPLLSRNMRTEISIENIEASKIRIIDKLDKLYPGYVRLGIGNYASPLGELYVNSTRNRRTSYGLHAKHNSSFGTIDGYAPSSFDNSTAHLFGEWHTSRFKIESEVDYLNHGYHFYGIEDTTDFYTKDSLRNRVQGIGGNVKFSNFTRKDSAKLLYTVKTGYMYFHEFKPEDDLYNRNARNTNFNVGTEMAYKLKKNVYALDFEVRYNKYKFAEIDTTIFPADRLNEDNTLIHLKPVISSYGENWKVIYGVDLNFDIPSDNVFKVVPIIEGKYSLFNNMFIPYAGIGGGVNQNTFQTLNCTNEFIASGINLEATREFKVYGGIKGTLSKSLAFNLQFHSSNFTNMPLFFNDTTTAELNRFTVIYDEVSALGINASVSYQASEKLKVDAVLAYNNYNAVNEEYAWHLPALDLTLRGSYNLYDKIYIKSDITFLGGRKSPEGAINPQDAADAFDLGFVADANLHAEYRYNSRISAFLQFNNLAAQKYFRWNRYRVQGFQVLGGVTFAF